MSWEVKMLKTTPRTAERASLQSLRHQHARDAEYEASYE
jgi:hypothetical protein